MNHQAFFAQAEVIRELADAGPCVIVGRCSDYILGDRPHCIKVFIHADLPSRIRRCVEEYHLPPENIRRHIIQMDRGRANYYSHYTGHSWATCAGTPWPSTPPPPELRRGGPDRHLVHLQMAQSTSSS